MDESKVTDQPMDLLQRNMNKSTEDESIMNENSVKESAGHPGVKSGKKVTFIEPVRLTSVCQI